MYTVHPSRTMSTYIPVIGIGTSCTASNPQYAYASPRALLESHSTQGGSSTAAVKAFVTTSPTLCHTTAVLVAPSRSLHNSKLGTMPSMSDHSGLDTSSGLHSTNRGTPPPSKRDAVYKRRQDPGAQIASLCAGECSRRDYVPPCSTLYGVHARLTCFSFPFRRMQARLVLDHFMKTHHHVAQSSTALIVVSGLAPPCPDGAGEVKIAELGLTLQNCRLHLRSAENSD